jgi:thiamine-phosphate pyrophosphorylase
MIRYAITSRGLYSGDELERQAALVREAARWAHEGLDFIQLREKDLPDEILATLARQILETISRKNSPSKLLINSRPDVAISIGAHGVHLTAGPDQLTPNQVRSLYASAGLPRPVISVSCHTLDDVQRSRKNQPDAILLAPVFVKTIGEQIISPGRGLDYLRAACTAAIPIPIYALGGVTLENANACVSAGAVGIAGIRLFHRS